MLGLQTLFLFCLFCFKDFLKKYRELVRFSYTFSQSSGGGECHQYACVTTIVACQKDKPITPVTLFNSGPQQCFSPFPLWECQVLIWES